MISWGLVCLSKQLCSYIQNLGLARTEGLEDARVDLMYSICYRPLRMKCMATTQSEKQEHSTPILAQDVKRASESPGSVHSSMTNRCEGNGVKNAMKLTPLVSDA